MLICTNTIKVIGIIATLEQKTHQQSKIHKECILQKKEAGLNVFSRLSCATDQRVFVLDDVNVIHFVNSFHCFSSVYMFYVFINSISYFLGCQCSWTSHL